MKPKVAFFDFASCEGCQLQIVNLEEDLLALVDKVDVVEFREAVTGKAPEYDIAFIEGSITRESDEARIKDIRARAKVLVTIGACSSIGGVNAIKNCRTMKETREIVYGKDAEMPHLDTYPTKAVGEVVKVDLSIHGCPINKRDFLRTVKEVLMGKTPVLADYPVCVDCKLKENICLYDKGMTCMGVVTRGGGCEAICPSNGSACIGCRGLVNEPNLNAAKDVLSKRNISMDEVMHKFRMFWGLTEEVKCQK